MNIYVPDYYKEFKCIAGRCKHNCCIGWEIDIDDDTYDKYKCVCGEFGKQLESNISAERVPHFILKENDRCPFLNENNLCDIITNLGEDYLCDICNDHPRYRNFFSDREEMGLGLCCEAAAELILGREEKTEFIKLSGENENPDKDEMEFFRERNEILFIVQNREIPLTDRINKLMEIYGIVLPYISLNKWTDFLKGLERLDDEWDKILEKIKKENVTVISVLKAENDVMNEQMLVYFIYRHLADGMYDGSIRERLGFAIVSMLLMNAIASATEEKHTEIARMYSSEIEYSEENTESFFELLK